MHQISLIKEAHVILAKYAVIFTFIFFSVSPCSIHAQEVPSYDEISVFLNVPRVGGGDIDAVILGEELYLPVTDLFDFLKIRNVPDQDLQSITGFFINPEATFTISRTDNKIVYQEKTYNLEPEDIIRTDYNLYLRSSYFGKVFGLECSFDFRSLSVVVNSKLELPLIREMRQEEMRKNLKRLKGEIKADTTVGRTYPGFKLGMADWSVNSSQEIKGKSSTKMTLGLGAMIAGGEATTSLYYDANTSFNWKYQHYLWRYVNNNFKPLRQISVGKIATDAISSIYNPVIGIKLTNTPTTYRRSFGSYTLSDYTEPGWIVELYVNNVLVDYVKADASGFFTFEVPLVYGNTIVNLKFIGPWGEEKTREQNFNIPFTFLPVKTLEYTVNAGIVQDTLNSIFSRASINYGLSRSMTIGGGVEYLSSDSLEPAMPYLNASLKITNNLLLTSEYIYGVRSKSTVSYRLPSNMQLDINYSWYHKDQTAIKYNYREERKATLSVPLHIGKLSTYQRFSFNQIVLPLSKYSTGEWLFSGSFFNINTNLTTYAMFVSGMDLNMYSNLALSFKLPAGIVCMPQVQYGYTQQKLLTAKIQLQKHLLKNAYLDASFERNNASNTNMAQLQFRYDFSFAQAGFNVSRSNKKTTLYQYARGSFISDIKTRYLRADNRTNVGKGGITVVAFIDFNLNGKKDPDEPKAYGLNLRANGGRVEKCDRDTTIRILGLEPYTSCFIELDPNSFENVAWRLSKKNISVIVDPNILKLIEIPITIAGEASGTIVMEKDGETKGIGRIILGLYSNNLKTTVKTLSEDDGYFSYFGLAPGKYFIRIDTAQLRKLGMVSVPGFVEFNVSQIIDGDIVDGLDFSLKMKHMDTTIIIPVTVVDTVHPKIVERTIVKKDTSVMIIHEATEELVTITEDCYAIQLGAFKKKSNAEALRRKLERQLGKEVEIIVENDFYKVRIIGIKDHKEVDNVISVLSQHGVRELWLTTLKAKQQIRVLIDKQDTITSINETITKIRDTVPNPNISIQAGAFRQESKAIALKEKLSKILDKPIVIVPEDGYFKVRIAGFVSRDEMKKYLPTLRKLGITNTWVLPERKEVSPPIVPSDTTRKPVEKIIEVPAIEKEPVVPKPTISLQVGVYHKRIQALHAQRKITSKLNLPVEIVEQWDYYHVIITGFQTREETYKYYPELAGLGYPKITLIEKK